MSDSIKKETITIQDIAEKLNISASTVSRALKNNSRISEKTKKEVWRVAKEMGYQLNMNSYFFDTGFPKSIGVVVPQIDNSLYIGAIRKIEEDARQEGYNVVVSYSQCSQENEEEIIKNFLYLKLDGIIISFVNTGSKPEYIEDVLSSNIPLVCIHNVAFDLPVPKIILDAYQGIFKAVKHLLSLSCKKIVLMLGDGNDAEYNEMLNGYKMALTSSGLQFKKELVAYANLRSGIEQTLEILFNQASYPDAIITPNNISALQVIAYFKNIGIRVPQDVSVVSFGSDPLQNLYTPSITSIHYSATDVGKAAIKQLFELIQEKKDKKPFHEKSVIAPVKLVIRGSSMRN